MHSLRDRLSIKGLRILVEVALLLDFVALGALWWWLPKFNSYLFGWENIHTAIAYSRQATLFLFAFFIWCGLTCGWWLVEGRGLLVSIQQLQAFTMSNARRLIRIATAFCLTAVAFGAKMFILPSLSTIFGIGLFLGVGLIFRVLAALFAHAADIKAENDLTI